MPMRRLLLLLSLILTLLPAIAWPAVADPAPTPATLTIANQTLFTFRADFGEVSPAQRAERAHQRITALNAADLQRPVLSTPFTANGVAGLRFIIHGKPLFSIIEADLDPSDGLNLLSTAQQVEQRLNTLRLTYLEQSSPEQIARAAALSLAATLALATALWGLKRLHQRAVERVLKRPLRARRWLKDKQDFEGVLRTLEQRLLDLSALVGVLLLVHLWLSFVLTRFPYTRPWGQQMGQSLFDLLANIADSVLSAVPGLVKVTVIFLLTRLAIRGLGLLFNAVENQRLSLPGLYQETVGATRRLTSLALWLFALTAAYPYLPGSNSDAFKGISVFFGLMVTLGSTGIMTHAMSGLVLVYSRALKPGDLVQVGDVDGFVSELGALSTKIITRHGNEVTLPNSVVVGGKVINYTRQAGERGLPLTTKITIGYDTPWRQVHAMLELAARRTAGLNQSEAPIVRQLNLQDFYIEYELEARMPLDAKPPAVKTALHSQILDVFNEFGVQIMSPNFENQPEGAVLVSKENWYAAPAPSAGSSAQPPSAS
ncbi:mechanosensitive ion channel domain-containing protein [Craterilacuibacter sp. RT1T]|uniref:mechanosensitive ion channel family protein n=1 Tax=Craterilacuibacter sp. RT1T TaxID=2942211 RepID=UPI0020BE9A4D|nr:mechanosensitive ion channel domain-containing protein [Craterilacuibacter sp. RT1T]MCL6263424.1 mechanosensitive ion channel family protein [Craterilacuibacter sp. RT1T]